MMIFPSDEAWTRAAMRYYRRSGYNPVPSRPYGSKKAPMVRYGRHWNQVGPNWWLDKHTRNVQVMTGCAWRLAVVDFDGPTAWEIWLDLTARHPIEPTWQSSRDPMLSRHLWFALPPDLSACPSCYLWEDIGMKHSAIEFKADKALIVAPPSVHVVTGQRYQWLPDYSPCQVRRPALIPSWLLAMALATIKPPKPTATTNLPVCVSRTGQKRYDVYEVLAAIGDLAAAARTIFGLRVVGKPNLDGWYRCHRMNDPGDKNPSASFHRDSGYYHEPARRIGFKFFETGAATGRYPSWQDCLADLGDRYLGSRPSSNFGRWDKSLDR